jgi:MFS family permease
MLTARVGAILTTFANGEAMFVVGRIITGMGCTTAATSAKSYLAEITSPASRGRWMGLLNSFCTSYPNCKWLGLD